MATLDLSADVVTLTQQLVDIESVSGDEKEITDARVLGGMHFRHSLMNGAQIGRKVAKNLVKNFFQELPISKAPHR